MLVNISNISIKKQISDGDIRLTDSECFSNLPWPLSTNTRSAKSADVKDDYIESFDVGDICTKGICVEDTCKGGTCIRDTCLRGASVKVVFVKSICTSNIFARSTYAKSVCVYSIDVVKYSKMHLQFFQILKIEDVKIKIRIGAGW